MARLKMPPGARRLRTYVELTSYLADFVDGRYPFLWVVGRPGLGKSESIKKAVDNKCVYYRKGGQLTPINFYIDCYLHRGQAIILDDAEHLLDSQVGAKLISALAETTPKKQLCYNSSSHLLDMYPKFFETTSSLCILANKVTKDDAIRSRAVTLFFDPTNLEIHRAVAGWFWDQQIHDWFGQHLARLQPLDVRWYVIASQDKQAGRNWQEITRQLHALKPASCLVQDLEPDSAYPTRDAKADRFVQLRGNAKGASRESYFQILHRLEREESLLPKPVPPMPLYGKPPSVTVDDPESQEVAESEHEVLDLAEEEAVAADVPDQERFTRPIRGGADTVAVSHPINLDDTLGWEQPASDHMNEEDEG